jgi:hypothetical protein
MTAIFIRRAIVDQWLERAMFELEDKLQRVEHNLLE